MEKYNEQYYKTLNYSNYLERENKYRKLAIEVSELLNKISLINKDSKIIDFGCAVGFLMSGLNEIGYKNVKGVEISDWARGYGKSIGNNNIFKFKEEVNNDVDFMFSLDVFEHMEDSEIIETLDYFNNPNLIVRIPSSVDGETFHLEVSRRDPTHINCKLKEDWISFFKNIGYKSIMKLNLFSIYDSKGISCFLALK